MSRAWAQTVVSRRCLGSLNCGVLSSTLATTISTQPDSCFSDLLSVSLFLQCSNSSFVVLPTSVHIQVVGVREVLGTLDTVEFAQTWQVFGSLGFLVLFQMSGVLEILLDLIEITVASSEASLWLSN